MDAGTANPPSIPKVEAKFSEKIAIIGRPAG